MVDPANAMNNIKQPAVEMYEMRLYRFKSKFSFSAAFNLASAEFNFDLSSLFSNLRLASLSLLRARINLLEEVTVPESCSVEVGLIFAQ